MSRLLVVVDGDNFYGSIKQQRYNLTLGQVLDLIRETADASSKEYVRAVVFRTRGRDFTGTAAPVISQRGKMELRQYAAKRELVSGHGITVDSWHGYPDSALMDYIRDNEDEFDELVLMTSDSDFLAFAEDIAARGGKKTTLFMFASNSRGWDHALLLKEARAQFLEDIFDLHPSTLAS